MSFDYAKAALKAELLIVKFGGAGTFVINGNNGGGYDNDGNPILPELDSYISGSVTPLLQYKRTEIDETNVLTGDAYVFFDGALVPDDATITINGNELRAVKTTTLTSVDGVLVYQKVQLRS